MLEQVGWGLWLGTFDARVMYGGWGIGHGSGATAA